jgi:hypothetical protein
MNARLLYTKSGVKLGLGRASLVEAELLIDLMVGSGVPSNLD